MVWVRVEKQKPGNRAWLARGSYRAGGAEWRDVGSLPEMGGVDISGEEEDAGVSNRQVVPTLNWIKAAGARTPLASAAPSSDSHHC